MRLTTKLLAAASIGVAASTAAALPVFDSISLGLAGPTGLNLGIFVTGPTTMNASNSGTFFNTNLGLANGASTNFSGGGTLTGNLYKDPGATVQGNINSQFNIGGSIITQNLSQAVTDVQTASQMAFMLTPDQQYNDITGGNVTDLFATGAVNAFGGRNTVIKVGTNTNQPGDIKVTNPSHNITIHGGVNDFFIINVFGDIDVTNGMITATGGITPDHILFNLTGNMGELSVSNSSSFLVGTYLAPFSGQKITLSPGTVDGAIIAYEIKTSSGPTVTDGPGFNIPGPSSVGLIALASLVATRRRR